MSSERKAGTGGDRATRVVMVREHLEGIPEHALQKGFALRWYRAGDEKHWLEIHRRADGRSLITEELFAQKFGSDEGELGRRQCYLVAPGGETIGTATAWFDNNFDGRAFGRVHYVAILPEFQGKGLSKPLMTVVCQRLKQLGHGQAYLTTSTGRPRAIRLYLEFGFAPLVRDEKEAEAWGEFCSPGARMTARIV